MDRDQVASRRRISAHLESCVLLVCQLVRCSTAGPVLLLGSTTPVRTLGAFLEKNMGIERFSLELSGSVGYAKIFHPGEIINGALNIWCTKTEHFKGK